jgi:hypothetical protein
MRNITYTEVVEVGIANFTESVQQGRANCSHALAFEYCFLCMHPRVNDIIENTKRTEQAVKS